MPDLHTQNGSILHGDVSRLHEVPDGYFQCCVTSPPYYKLRSYLPTDHPDKKYEIGNEPTPELYIENLTNAFRIVRQKMHESGLLFLNLGDKMDGGVMNLPHLVAESLRADGWYWVQTIVWCLSGGTMLYARTNKGECPSMLKDLVRLDPKTVSLWNGEKWTQVVSWTKNNTARDKRSRKDKSKFLEIEFRNGERVGCTETHLWPTNRGLIPAMDIVPGDVVPTCNLPEPKKESCHCIDDESLGWLIGFYVAEGNKTEGTVHFSVHQDESAEFEKVKRIASLLDGTATFRNSGGKSASITVYSHSMSAIIGEYVFGGTSKTKRLTLKSWMKPNVFLESLMNGYLDGDGHYDSKNNRWRIGFTNNDYLASDLRVISARLGYALSLRRSKHRCQTGVFDGYRGELRKTRNGDHHSSRPLGEVVAIRNSRAREFWDIEVADEPHTFALASGILSHNCKPSCLPESMKGWRWERCRVKVKSRRGENNPHPSKTGGVNYQGDGGASWQLCPGCSKCTPNDGWILRRGSGRCTNSYEYIFVMAKSSEYFWNSAEFVEEAVSKIGERNRTSTFNKQGDVGNHHQGADKILDTGFKNPRSVWTISSEPSKKKHWASYPSEIPRRAITAGTSSGGCCPQCRSPYAPMVVSEQLKRERPNDRTDRHDAGDGVNSCGNTVAGVKTNITGYRPSCSCGVATPVPCAVLDIFAGTGTTAQVAQWMGRDWLLTELYDQYIEICKEKIFSTPPRCSIKKAAKKGRQQKETATKPVCPPTRRPTRDNRVPLPGQKELL